MEETAGREPESEMDQKETERRWKRFEREMQQETYNNGESCCSPWCCKMIEYSYALFLVCFFLVVPFLMIYVGVKYQWCEDWFADWLLIGGVLLYAGCLMFIARWFLAKKEVKTTCVTIAFFVILVIILIGLGFGLGRIMDGSMAEDPFMSDPECRFYLFKFPFWLMLSPILIVSIIACGWINSDRCGHGDTCCGIPDEIPGV